MRAVSGDYGDNWPAVEAKARAQIAFAQENGFALSDGDWIVEANSAGAPAGWASARMARASRGGADTRPDDIVEAGSGGASW